MAVALDIHIKSILKDNFEILQPEDVALAEDLLAAGQSHLFSNWPEKGTLDDGKQRLMRQLKALDTQYAGGLVQYIKNARKLLEESRAGVNPFEGCMPSVPEGDTLDFGSDIFQDLERQGVDAARDAAFVLVAGGLGERLGYSGIKIELPVESASSTCFLQLYIESILALQSKHPGRLLPLAIMTSDDTHAKTIDLLQRHDNFGAESDQITLLKQEKVPCLSDGNASLAIHPKDPFLLQTKPHGHGDVHMLLHTSGLAEQWARQGFKWVCFFQDTNGLVFRGLPAALGVSVRNAFDINSLAVPRKAGEAIGAITKLTSAETGREMTINVEYNQLDPLLRATICPDGDINDETGYSPFPGNINQLIVSMDPYIKELHRSGGLIAEFVNPKYADASKTVFKSSTRLECMMQDLPKGMPDGTRVGFTVISQVWAAYSPVKNSPAEAAAKAASGGPSHSATSGELDSYQVNCRSMRILGAHVADPTGPLEFNGLKNLELWPRIAWTPLWALTFDDLRKKIPHPEKIYINKDAVLVIKDPSVVIEELTIEEGSALVVDQGASTQPKGVVKNEGWKWVPLENSESSTEIEKIRGFRIVRS